jgi:hypothetical protein
MSDETGSLATAIASVDVSSGWEGERETVDGRVRAKGNALRVFGFAVRRGAETEVALYMQLQGMVRARKT